MIELIQSKLTNPQFLLSALVALERERIRARERERLVAEKGKRTLRQEPKAYMKNIVERFSLSKWLGTGQAKAKMAMAGFRGPQAEVAFLFFRLVTPSLCFIISTLYVFAILNLALTAPLKAGIVIFSTYLGLKAPEIYISNTISKRQLSIRRAFPDALDLLLICVESGMSVEHAFAKVAQEIGTQSIPL